MATKHPPRGGPAGRRNGAAIAVLLGPFLALFALTFVGPIGYAMYQSVIGVERMGALGLEGSRTVFVGLDNYIEAFNQLGFIEGFGTVALFALVQVPLMLALATLLALLLETLSDRWAGLFRAGFFLPYGVPGVIASLLWGFLYTPGTSPITELLGRAGLQVDFFGYDTVLWSLVNIAVWQFAGYNVLVLVAQLKAIPRDLYEAAAIDGASLWTIAWRIQIPLIRPALVLTAVFSIIGAMQLFSEPLVLQLLAPAITDDYTPNLSAYKEAFTNNNPNLAAAQAVILAVVAGVLSFGFLRLVGWRRT
ncbi:carbohydrate ABC transporter membrane protein 1 (CUT1 family) [Murinocardiopsis flavida]|uniref:Carbohydrate ABC transporter membrane protein 1 (CUT1 family) n=2 Tax=Murinocardiopsis flavida TaxID=645275 RepID=A0A2P8CYZ2_9ACTN|nr:carbohydrate ABC transporter membrane protein 1 (CUT1 family) [Murinocardiopsis flavida]